MPSVKSTICNAALEVIENKEATVGDKLKACTILLRLKALVPKGKPRGRGFAREVEKPQSGLDSILAQVQ